MGLPPTSSKISTDANEVTTFKFDFPNFTGTHTGTDLSLGINSVPGGGTGLGTLTLIMLFWEMEHLSSFCSSRNLWKCFTR